MAKKNTEKKSSKKAATSTSRPATRKKSQAPTLEVQAIERETVGGTASVGDERRASDPRLPPAGTVIEKRDRGGKVRCHCTMEEEGVRYSGALYKSLSAAAVAAAKDLGLAGTSQDGFTFWGLSKPPRRSADPIGAVTAAWGRYRDRLAYLVANGVTDENRRVVLDLLKEHADTLGEARTKAA